LVKSRYGKSKLVVTLIYNSFDQDTIDIFKLMCEKYGAEKAISYAGQLFKGKNKNNKHDWVKDPQLGLDLDSLSSVVSYNREEKDPCFHITCANQKVIRDQDGSVVDKILTDIARNAGLDAQSYLANKVSESNDDERENQMQESWYNSSIYDSQKKETIHDYMIRFKNLRASKPHLLSIIPSKVNQP
jgi:hypothetical protein